MDSHGIHYLFISANFDDMMELKTELETQYRTLSCDIALKYNPSADISSYCLLLVDLFSITEYPIELLGALRQTTPAPIAVLVQPDNLEEPHGERDTPDSILAQLYDIGADTALPNSLEVAKSYLGAFYKRHVFFQHQEQIRHRSTMVFRDELVIEPKRRRVTICNEAIGLSFREFELLNYLACNADIVVTYEMIADRVWGSAEIVNSTIFSAVTRLRQKVEPDPERPTYIQTMRGAGYLFKSHIVEKH